MNKKQYLEQRKALLDEAEVMIGEGKTEDANAKMKEVEALDNKWEEVKIANVNMEALKGSIVATDLTSKSINVDGGIKVDSTVKNVGNEAEYRTAFLKKLQGKELSENEKVAYSLVPDTAGAVVPTQTANMIFDNMTRIAPMLNEIQLLRVAGNLRFAVQGTRNAAEPHAENAPIIPSADTMVAVTLTGYEFVKVIRISATIQTMAIDAFESWIAKILGEDLAVAIDDQIINGGTVTGSISAAQAWVDGTNQITAAANVAYTDVTSLIALLPSSFDGNAKFLMNKATFYNQIMNVADANGNLLAVPDLASPGQYRILGYPVLIDDNVATNEIYLGDYKQVVGNLSSDIKVVSSAESGFLNNSIDFRGTAIFDCDVAQPTAIVKLAV